MKSKYSEELERLVNDCFTDEFKENKIVLDVLLNSLDINVERTDVYDDGVVLNSVIELTTENKEKLSSVIKDFDKYNKLVDLNVMSDKKENQTDVVGILDYSENTSKQDVRYNIKKNLFYYKY